MKVQFDPETDTIIAFGPNLTGDDVFQGPEDFSFNLYEYQSSIPGTFDPTGFTPKPPITEICWHCGQEYTISHQ